MQTISPWQSSESSVMKGKVTLRYLVNTAGYRHGFPFNDGVCVNLSRCGQKLGKTKSYGGKPFELSFKMKVRLNTVWSSWHVHKCFHVFLCLPGLLALTALQESGGYQGAAGWPGRSWQEEAPCLPPLHEQPQVSLQKGQNILETEPCIWDSARSHIILMPTITFSCLAAQSTEKGMWHCLS